METEGDKNGEIVQGAAEGDASNGKKQQTETKQEGMVYIMLNNTLPKYSLH